jgi:hypothetical protein
LPQALWCAYIEAQKKLVDIAGKQMNANMKTAGKSLEPLRPFSFVPLSELTQEGVKAYANAQKALMDSWKASGRAQGSGASRHITQRRQPRPRRRRRKRPLPESEPIAKNGVSR